ncbi:SDR family NAD(P)-dependent oxidoreductase [Streptomyces sp. NPDC058385]|uniref:SDR family NAD(P)-dependent oxidoreductase n=1 Tax=Streptomyces sp. NPDC058385 TaxID=3346473 RepID=UPI0036508033
MGKVSIITGAGRGMGADIARQALKAGHQVVATGRRPISISSLAGVVGLPGTTAYGTSKFGLEGWMESLRFDLEPFGIHTTVVEPGYFRTELLMDASSNFAELSIDDYGERSAAMQAGRARMKGRQAGDPVKLADALLKLVDLEEPPLRFVAGSDAIEAVAAKARELLAQAKASRELGMDLAHTDVV